MKSAKIAPLTMGSDYAARFDGLPRRSLDGGRTVIEATTGRARRRGLSRLPDLPPDHALLIPRCRAIHTFGMHFALDLIWVGNDGSVVRLDREVRPHRMRICPRARSVVEVRAGQAGAFIDAGALAPAPGRP